MLDVCPASSLSETKLSANKKSEKDIDFVAVLDVPGNQWKIFASKQRNFSNLFYGTHQPNQTNSNGNFAEA